MRNLFLTVFFAIITSVECVADTFPSEDELDGIIKGCGIGISNKVQASVSSSIQSWRKAAVAGDASYSELGAILAETPDGAISPENYKTYTQCILDLVKEFRTERGAESSNRDCDLQRLTCCFAKETGQYSYTWKVDNCGQQRALANECMRRGGYPLKKLFDQSECIQFLRENGRSS
jgi:hypothetical protein